jgi:uroporphyrinogen-III synthase
LKILVTRPEPGATVTATKLARLGFEPILLPCLTIKLRGAKKFPERPAAIIITSAQAIPALPENFRLIPCFCVGDATAAKLREAGFASVESAAGDAKALFRLIAMRRITGVHLLAVGERHGLALARQLRAAGITVVRRSVYAAQPLRILPAAMRAALANGEIDKALFYSAETAKAFIRLAPPATARIESLALSPAIAEVLRGLPWRSIRVALAPAEADLLALLR